MEIQIYDKTIQFFSSTWWKQNRNKIWIYDSDSCWTCFEDKTMWISNYARYWVRKVTLEWSLTLSEIYWPSAEDFSQFMPRFKCASGQVDLNLTSFVWEKISMTESRSPRRRNGESQLCKQKNDKKVRRREFIARFQSSGEANTSGSYFATSRNGRPRPQQKIHSRKRAAKNYNRAKSSSPHACALFTPREDHWQFKISFMDMLSSFRDSRLHVFKMTLFSLQLLRFHRINRLLVCCKQLNSF